MKILILLQMVVLGGLVAGCRCPCVSNEQVEGVTIVGEIQNPGVYTYEPDMTIATLVERAGGFTRFNYGLKLRRGEEVVFDEYLGSPSRVLRSPLMHTVLEPGDEVRIRRETY